MGLRRTVVNRLLKSVLDIFCKIDNSELFDALTKNGPLIMAINHINFLEVPIIATHNYPLYLTGLVKAETWNNPFFAFLCNTYRAIPIDRNGAFQGAFQRVRDAIQKGFFVVIAPEGTRSLNGVLGKGKPGIVQLAIDYNVPVLPVAHYGGEQIWSNVKRFRRTSLCFKAGRPFKIKFNGKPMEFV